jgi:hypothetical protein
MSCTNRPACGKKLTAFASVALGRTSQSATDRAVSSSAYLRPSLRTSGKTAADCSIYWPFTAIRRILFGGKMRHFLPFFQRNEGHFFLIESESAESWNDT